MMEDLDDNTLEELARLICGDDDGPIYRKGYELPRLLQRADGVMSMIMTVHPAAPG